jgi:hypothetical protein
MNQGWLTNSSTIANSGGPFDPPVYGYPAVDFSNGLRQRIQLGPDRRWWASFTEGDAIYNYNKQGTPLAVGAPVTRDYGWKENEVLRSRIPGRQLPPTSRSHTGLRYGPISRRRLKNRHAGWRVQDIRLLLQSGISYALSTYYKQSVLPGENQAAPRQTPSAISHSTSTAATTTSADFWTPDKARHRASPRASRIPPRLTPANLNRAAVRQRQNQHPRRLLAWSSTTSARPP